MRQDQLERARQARWRQDGNALLTLDDAERWLAETPLCLFLPRYQHLPVPAPTFVEAIAGRADATPGPERIAAANDMLARLVASGAVIALNLFGAVPGIGVSSFVGEQPDFLATPEALPYLYALQSERNPKRPPSTVGASRVSPLASEAYQTLEREGALTTVELRSRLGREVTEAAVLRALAELWHTMRVVPVPAEAGEDAHWELLSARHRRELNVGSTQSQTTALSILASFYLQSAIAATAEQIEIFLSPVASRSRIRDVVHGLSTTRQLASFSLDGEEQFYVEGTLPEVAEEEPVPAAAIAGEDAGLEQNEPSLTEAAAIGVEPVPPPRERPAAPSREFRRREPRPAFADRARRSFAGQDRRDPSRTPSGDRPPREGGFGRPQRGAFRQREGRSESGEATARPSRPDFERRPRRSFDSPGRPNRPGRADRPDRPQRPGTSGERSRPDRPRFQRSDRSDRPARSAGGFRRDKPAGEREPRTGEGNRRFSGGRDRRDDRPRREGSDTPSRPFRKGEDGTRRFEGRPPRRDGERGGQGDRPFKRPYAPRGERPGGSRAQRDRPERRGPADGSRFAGPRSSRTDRPERRFPSRPRSEARSDSGEQERRPFRAGGQRPGGKPGFSKPSFGKSDFGNSGGFRKSGGSGESFGKPRPAGAGFDRPRTAEEKGRISTTTSSGKPRPARPGGFSKARPESRPGRSGRPSGRPPAKGGFKAGGGFRPGDAKRPGGQGPGNKAPGGKRPGGFGAPRRKPRRESGEGDEG